MTNNIQTPAYSTYFRDNKRNIVIAGVGLGMLAVAAAVSAGTSSTFLLLGTFAATAFGGAALLMNSSAQNTPLVPKRQPITLHELIAECESSEKDIAQVQTSARRFVLQEQRRYPALANLSEASLKFLSKKIAFVVFADGSYESKQQIIQNIITNLAREYDLMNQRIERDLRAGSLIDLGIDPRDRVISIEPLGEETHNGGKIPYKITFESQNSVVYKPRSVLPEKLICDPQEGILRHEKFGTYKVACSQDSQGDYGYCEFLKNLEIENTIQNEQQLEEYVTKMLKLELISKRLGLSDLHYQNIITRRLEPCIIDAEVFLNPENRESGLLNSDGPLHRFADYEDGKMVKGKNYIKIQRNDSTCEIFKIIDSVPFNSRKLMERLPEECWQGMGYNFEERIKGITLAPQTEEAIESASKRLGNTPSGGRYVLTNTKELRNFLKYWKAEFAAQGLYDQVIRDLNEADFEFIQESSEALIEAINEDLLNNDCPIFFYSKNNHTCYYGKSNGEFIPIGRMRTS